MKKNRRMEDSWNFSRERGRWMARQVRLFLLCLLAGFILSLILPLRPNYSEVEKRDLAAWPDFSWETLLSGDYFAGITQYAQDTPPFRDTMLASYATVQDHFGIRAEQMIHRQEPTVNDVAPEPVPETEEPEAEEAWPEWTAPNRLDDGVERAGDLYVQGDQAFELFYYTKERAEDYANLIGAYEKELGDHCQIYDMIIPLSTNIAFSDADQAALGSSTMTETMANLSTLLEAEAPGVKQVLIQHELEAHADEYLYFRTDHHWTQRGAYYAYRAFCEAKGIVAHALSDYESEIYPGFLGTFYAASGQLSALREHPDEVEVFYPLATNEMSFWLDGRDYPWQIIRDVSEWDSPAMYSAFAGGDQPWAEIHNPELNDGSAITVMKESYGNALIPFLVDHYEDIYIVDFRFFGRYPNYGGKLSRLIEEKEVDDLLIMNGVMSMLAPVRQAEMRELLD